MAVNTNVLLLAAVISCASLTRGYITGPPTTACGGQIPNHGFSAQTTASPYTIKINSNTYDPATNITVTIEATGSNQFEGFFIQARRADCNQNETAVGEFYIEVDSQIKYIDCSSKINNGVVHTSNSKKTKKTFQWFNSAGGDVYFRATFVRVKSTFWTNVESDFLIDSVMNTGKTYTSCKGKSDMPSASTSSSYSLAVFLMSFFLLKLSGCN